MDSTLVTMMAAAASPARLKTFTGVFADPPSFDESAYARAVAEACGAEQFEVRPTQRQFVDLMPKIVYHLDEPCAGPGAFPQYLVSHLAASHVKVVLGGQGGDEVFGGYARYLVAYLEQALKGAIFDTNEEQEHVVSLQSIVANLPVLHEYVPMLRRFWSEELFEPMDRRYFRLIDRSEGSMDLLAGDFRLAFNREEVFARFQRVFNHPDTLSYYNKMTHFDLVCSLPALLQVEDRMSMAASVESRVPLLDRRIVDLVGRMPPRLKFRGGALKASLRRAVGDLLPPTVAARRDKMGFPVPLHIWMDGEVGDFCRDTLLSRAARNRGLFDPAAVARLLTGQGAFDRRLWGVLNLEIWFSTFLDGSVHPEAKCH
jgi:asparagine synthase (glutamine-hydrolysing)